MAVEILKSDVREVIDTTASDDSISYLIEYADTFDASLDNANVPDQVQRLLKINLVAHLLELQDGGQVKSESDSDGNSVTYNTELYGEGFAATKYGNMILYLPGGEIISNAIDKPKRFFVTV